MKIEQNNGYKKVSSVFKLVIIIIATFALGLGFGLFSGYVKADSNAVYKALEANKNNYNMAETICTLAKEIQTNANLANNGLRAFTGEK